MIPGRLRLRFVVAAGLLVLTTVTASVWTFYALTRLSGVVTDTVQQSELVTAVTSRLAGALEREDDAVLLILAGDRRGTQVLASERATADRAIDELFNVLGPTDERELASPLQAEMRAYRHAADAVVLLAAEQEALLQYHQKANPLLRRAVSLTTAIRDRHFEFAQRAVAGARDQAAGARRAVLLITLVALGIAVVVTWHLTRTVVGPVRRLTRGANAIREGDFSERIDVAFQGRAWRARGRVQSNGRGLDGLPAHECRRSRAGKKYPRSHAGGPPGRGRVAGCGGGSCR